jgi:nucleoid DNA-binding protein
VTRKDLVMRFAERMQMDPEEVASYVDTFLEVVLDTLGQGERIEIRGFGVFQIEEREERKSRNPRTGESVLAGPKRTVRFKMGKELRERVREAGFRSTAGGHNK